MPSTTDVAAMAEPKTTRHTVEREIHRGHLKAEKVGRTWVIDDAEAKRWAASYRRHSRHTPGSAEPAPLNDVLPWQPGDIVLSADQRLYARAREGSAGRGVWCRGVDDAAAPGRDGAEGDTADAGVARPLTLLIRGGHALAGIVVDDRTV